MPQEKCRDAEAAAAVLQWQQRVEGKCWQRNASDGVTKQYPNSSPLRKAQQMLGQAIVWPIIATSVQ